MTKIRSIWFTTLALSTSLLVTGCAGSATKAVVVQPLTIDHNSNIRIADVTVEAADGVWLRDEHREVIQRKIQDILDKTPQSNGSGKGYHMKVTLTRFDEGSAAARLTLIGLGQIHIEGGIRLFDDANKPAGEYQIKKTFVGGGFYGGFTSLESVEDGFAKSVIAGLNETHQKKP